MELPHIHGLPNYKYIFIKNKKIFFLSASQHIWKACVLHSHNRISIFRWRHILHSDIFLWKKTFNILDVSRILIVDNCCWNEAISLTSFCKCRDLKVDCLTLNQMATKPCNEVIVQKSHKTLFSILYGNLAIIFKIIYGILQVYNKLIYNKSSRCSQTFQ